MNADVLCCDSGGRLYGVRAQDARAIVRSDEMTADTASDGRLGSIKQGGVAIAVYSADRLVNPAAPAAREHGHVVIVNNATGACGWLFDRIVRRVTVTVAAIMPLPHLFGSASADLFEGLVTSGSDTLLVMRTTGSGRAADISAEAPRPAAGPVGGPARAFDGGALITFAAPSLGLPAGMLAAVSVKQVCEVLTADAIMPVPRAPVTIHGALPWRGHAVPVIDVAGPVTVDFSKLLIAGQGQRRGRLVLVAIPIDGDARLQRVTADARRLTTVSRTYDHGCFEMGDSRIAVIDIKALAAVVARGARAAEFGMSLPTVA